MGHSSSKNSEQSGLKARLSQTESPSAPLSPLQSAVLYKKHLKTEQLLLQTQDVNGLGEIGLSLLHLAVLPSPPVSFHPVKYYKYLWSSSVAIENTRNITRMIALLFERGAKLTPDNFKLNPLESLYYCSAKPNQCLHLANVLSKSVDITVDNIIRYSVWRLLQRSELIHGTKAIIECCKWGPKKEVFNSMALFVKHGIRPDLYFSGMTPKCNSIFECCHELNQILCVEENIIQFEYWEFKVNIWLRLWDFNDPLSFAFNLHLLNSLQNSPDFFEKRTKRVIERVISSWVRAPAYIYLRLCVRVIPSITLIRKIVGQASNHSNKHEIIDKMIDFALLKRFLEMLTDIILTQNNKTHYVEPIIYVSFEIYQLLIQIYGSDYEIPLVQTETFSTSLAKVIRLYQSISTSVSTSPLFRFVALFDPDINARNAQSGRTPIQDALLYGNIFMVQTLLEGGANPFTVDRDGNSFVDQLNTIIASLGMGPAREVYEETRDKYVILNKPYPLLTLAATAIVRNNIPFAILGRQPRLYNMILYYLPPT